ncbi:hypothetical protein [Streptomyces luteogriseus]|uniref:hypothetical protein n=1 Tax=Streptomyces luteogriseus TaxID=68233 RepID=UPI0037B93353
MARLWTCGFELQSTSAEFGVNSGAIVTGAPSISTTVHRAGTAALRSNPAAATAFVEHQIMPGTVMRTIHRLYLRVDAYPNTNTNIYGIGQGGYFPALLRLQPDGTLVLRDGFVETTLAGTSPVLTLGRWYRVELDYTDVAGTLTAGVAPFKGYLDGVQFADALCSNINGFSRIRMGVQLAATTDFYIDDVAINDTTGSVQNGLPGPGNVVHLRPNAAGDNNGWATAVGGTAGAANNYTRVNERPPDDATSYNETSATGTTTIDDFNVEDAATAGISTADTITLVQVGGRVASNAATAASIVYRLKGQSGGTVQESASVTVANTSWSVHAGQSPRPYQLTAYTNPQSAAAWTPTALNSIQIGYRGNVSQTTVRRVSTLWALVEYLPATSHALGTGVETDTALALARSKRQALGTTVETEAAQAVTVRRARLLGTAGEVDAVQAPGRARARTLPVSAETGTARPLPGTKRLPASIASTTVTARALSGAKHIPIAPAGAVDTARPLTGGKRALLAPAVETEAGQTAGRQKTSPVGPGVETGTALPVPGTKRLALAPAVESATVYDLPAAVSLRTGTETDSARPLTGSKRRTLSTAASTSAAQPLDVVAGLRAAGETSTARPLGPSKTTTQGVAGEVGEVRPMGRAKRRTLGWAAETSAVGPLTGGSYQGLAPAEETSTALLLGRASARALPTATSVDEALNLTSVTTGQLPAAADTSTAQTATGRKTLALAATAVAEFAQQMAGRKASPLGAAAVTITARTLGTAKRRTLGAAVETAEALRLLIPGTAASAQETAAARPLTGAKASLAPLAESINEALPLGGQATLQLGRATEFDEALPAGRRKTQAPATAGVVCTARSLAAGKRHLLGTAAETGRALIGPAIRLAQAIDRAEAMALTGRRQRPADALTASTSGPTLHPSTSGPDLTAHSSGPHLAASSTSGG